MDELVERSVTKTRQALREHADKVEALAQALLETEELDAEEAAAILGPRPGSAERPLEAQVAG
jgi:ATP-dependent Zn protease